MIGGLWICPDCASQARTEARVGPGGFRVYVLLRTTERLAYLDHHEGDWTRIQLEHAELKGAARLREIAFG
jgi:hypothetical protein